MLTLRYNEPVFILMLRARVGCFVWPNKNLELSVHGMKTYGGKGGITPVILKLCTGSRRVVTFMLQPRYPLGKNLRGRDRRFLGHYAAHNGTPLRAFRGHLSKRRKGITPTRRAKSQESVGIIYFAEKA